MSSFIGDARLHGAQHFLASDAIIISHSRMSVLVSLTRRMRKSIPWIACRAGKGHLFARIFINALSINTVRELSATSL